MPIETVDKTELTYHLICFDAAGDERTDDPDGHISQRALDVLQKEPITDVFLMSHGWMGDIPAAKKQYNDWTGSMAGNPVDVERARKARPGFQPLLIGLHWPSLPFGEEELGGGAAVSFAGPGQGGASPIDELIEEYSQRLADTPAAREALQTIFSAAIENVEPRELPADVIEAYQLLDRETALGSGDAASDPGSDREPFDAERTYESATEEMASFGGFGFGGLLAPLRTMSFWKMKDRASKFGESGSFELLRQLQNASDGEVRFHLMGHSFGCVVMSATLSGASEDNTLVRPVDSVALLQGALSLWSYAADIPHAPGQAGYFHRIISEGRVAGPIVTTQSEYDTAVGKLYPLAAGAARQVTFAPGELPKYGALGTFGVRGLDEHVVDMEMLPADGSYNFAAGKIYNLESSQIIRTGGPPSGAHSDLAHPEVAHVVWEAMLCGLAGG